MATHRHARPALADVHQAAQSWTWTGPLIVVTWAALMMSRMLKFLRKV
jgi:hypothetical protein